MMFCHIWVEETVKTSRTFRILERENGKIHHFTGEEETLDELENSLCT